MKKLVSLRHQKTVLDFLVRCISFGFKADTPDLLVLSKGRAKAIVLSIFHINYLWYSNTNAVFLMPVSSE